MAHKASQDLFSFFFVACQVSSTHSVADTLTLLFKKFPGILLPQGYCICFSLCLQGTSFIYPHGLFPYLKFFSPEPHSQWGFPWPCYILQPPLQPTLLSSFCNLCPLPPIFGNVICLTTFMTLVYCFSPSSGLLEWKLNDERKFYLFCSLCKLPIRVFFTY